MDEYKLTVKQFWKMVQLVHVLIDNFCLRGRGLINYHIHSQFCHGIGELEEYVDAAIQNNLSSIGFTSHAPLPFKKDWAMNSENLEEYCRKIQHLKTIYRDRIDIFLGLEVDYIPDKKRFEKFRSAGLDYIIGSNHFIGKDEDGKYKRIESSKTPKTIEGDVEYYIRNYYESVSEMVLLEKPDIIGHLDLIKKVNIHNLYFNENEEWYIDIVDKTLDIIANSNVIVEVNTSGLGKEQGNWLYPSVYILNGCFTREIPITLGSDAHKPDDIISGYEEACDILKKIGFKKVMILTTNGWKYQNIISV